ncbi:MAG TPA: hypothetical protein VEV87_03980 [Chitinophagaceae bacterium]|nr:hypothetical protein [Chitinophagaceae bacterium]
MIKYQKKTLKTGTFVDTAHVDTVIRTYKQERWVHNTERIGKEDSLSTWYSIEELEEFMEAAKRNGADGVKIYFAAYPNDFAKEPAYAGRQSVVLVATKQKQTDEGILNKDVYVDSPSGAQILAYNFGQICPPYCGGKGTGADDGLGIAIVDIKGKGLSVI